MEILIKQKKKRKLQFYQLGIVMDLVLMEQNKNLK